MTTFDDREKAFEDKFAHDAVLAFQAKARRTTKLGQWAADTLGLTGAEVDAYIRDVRTAGLSEKGDAEVFGKIAADFKAKAINVGDLEIRAAMNRYLSEAVTEINAR